MVQKKQAPSIVMKQYDREIEKILDPRTMGANQKNRCIDFLIQWKGMKTSEATCERDVNLWKFEKMM